MGQSVSSISSQDLGLCAEMPSDCGLQSMCCTIAGSAHEAKGKRRSQKSGLMRGFQMVNSPAKLSSNQSTAGYDLQASPPNSKAASPNQSSAIKKNRDSIEQAAAPVWLRDPEPLSTWTVEQQRVFITQLDDHPWSRNHSHHLQKAIEKTHRLIPEKSIREIEECYKHLQAKRIAYFGPTTRK